MTAGGLESTTAAVMVGDQAHLVGIADDGDWGRRGLLQRLVRSGDASEKRWRALRAR
jgi:hypothetical protein